MEGKIEPGDTAEKTIVVDETLTASRMGSGSIRVFATPAMIALMEAAAVAAIEGALTAEQTSVGIAVNVEHLAATPPGQTVRAVAVVTSVSGRRVSFIVRAWDESELIGEGTHTRFVVDERRFMERVLAKTPG